MDRKLTAIALATILVTSGLGLVGAGAVGGDVAQAGNATGQTTAGATVSVSATGTATADPDRAVVSLATSATAPTAGAATDRLAANVSTLRGALEDPNLSVESVRTTGFQVFAQRENGSTVYVARQSFAVTTTDPGAASDVVDAAVAVGPTEVNGVVFTLSDERRRELRTEAIDAAVTDARVQAEALADSSGLTLGEIPSISTGGGFHGPAPVRLAEATDIDASPVSVSASVQVTYNASN
jgi:uncharacterized protein YggE